MRNEARRSRAAQLRELQRTLGLAIEAGERVKLRDGAGSAEVDALLVRLGEIQAELTALRGLRSEPAGGDLYPFWVKLARRAGR